MRLPVIQTESRLGGRLWHRPRGPQLTSYLKNPSGRRSGLSLECPGRELRNHGVGWMRAVERLRNGGVPQNPVFFARNPLSKSFINCEIVLCESVSKRGLAVGSTGLSHTNPARVSTG